MEEISNIHINNNIYIQQKNILLFACRRKQEKYEDVSKIFV